mmetsp:Transcript_11433/g.35314  ORF Transcript_11433/g.35314 Transcript_11433/m.35314 type:complete len:240 (-) Transcript_11433:1341-2060(-)
MEDVLLAHRAALGLLFQDLVLGARERVQQPRHVLLLQVELLTDLAIRQALVGVEEHQQRRLVRGHRHLDGLGLEEALDLHRPKREEPLQLAVLGLGLVVLLEELHARLHLLGHAQIRGGIRRPVAGGQHRHRQVQRQLVRCLPGEKLLEVAVVLPRHREVIHHALHLGCELCAALLLQLGQHRALVIVVGTLVEEQPPRELLARKLAKEVLVAHVRQQSHYLFQLLLHRVIRQLLAAAL